MKSFHYISPILIAASISLAAPTEAQDNPDAPRENLDPHASLEGIPPCFINCFVHDGKPHDRYERFAADTHKWCNNPIAFGSPWDEKHLIPCAKKTCPHTDYIRNAVNYWRRNMCPDCPNPACWKA
ncbi:hypothetical protein GE09DRAFT_1087459 [Coniochaeta sp. 2T2.1]|nr:hypothetical protein GE09DRAFT_1087459 [Coniochaeta sp. 2T2.1]